MKKLFLLVGFFLLISPNLFAQKKVQGYFISANTGNKYEVTFLIPVTFLPSAPNYARMQTEILYLGDDGETSKVLKPENTLEVSFIYKDKVRLMRSVYNNLSRKNTTEFVFLEVVVDGSVTLYNYYETGLAGGSASFSNGVPMGRKVINPLSKYYKRRVLNLCV